MYRTTTFSEQSLKLGETTKTRIYLKKATLSSKANKRLTIGLLSTTTQNYTRLDEHLPKL